MLAVARLFLAVLLGLPRQDALDEVRALWRAAEAAAQAGDWPAAREASTRGIERALAASGIDAGVRADALWQLGFVALRAGELDAVRAAWQETLRHAETLFDDDDLNLAWTRGNLAGVLRELGALDEAQVLQEQVLAVREAALPADHADLATARAELAITLHTRGDFNGAHELFAAVLDSLRRTLPEGDPRLDTARLNLANSNLALGELEDARVLLEEAIESATAARDDPLALARMQLTLGTVLERRGELDRARALTEWALEALEERLPDGHPNLDQARENLAAMLLANGDLVGARALQERVLAARERALGEDHLDLARARLNLAATLKHLLDFEAARELEERALAARRRALPDDHPELNLARRNLASTLFDQDDLDGARTLLEKVLEVDEHDEVARGNLSIVLHRAGEHERALELATSSLPTRARVLPEDDGYLLVARFALAELRFDMGLADELAVEVPALADLLLKRLDRAFALAPREARGAVVAETRRLACLLRLASALEPGAELDALVFELFETCRVAATSIAEDGDDPEVARLRAEALALRQQLNDLVASGDFTGRAPEIAEVALARDRIEARLRSRRPASVAPVDCARLAAALPAGSVAVGFRSVPRMASDWKLAEERMLAHVLRPDGRLARLDLGPCAAIDAAVEEWRAAVGEPLGSAARGVATGPSADPASAERLRAAGERLRALVLDPLRAAIGEARTLFVGLDGALHLVPLDALPLDDGLVGERFVLRCENSFGRLLDPRLALDAPPRLVAFGGAAFGEREPARFQPLDGTLAEVERLSELFTATFEGREPEVRTGSAASKDALHELAPGARFLHLATHGYFAESPSAERAPGFSPMDPSEHVRGLAPLALCGLAFAGANLGRDAAGRMNGILTAEELAGIDLSSCELAVLSACETGVGLRDAGLGVQSLRAALHAAGARSAVTSLWKVDDEWTVRLMSELYSRMWQLGESKADALWCAKMAIRTQGASAADWAAWVLSGDPE